MGALAPGCRGARVGRRCARRCRCAMSWESSVGFDCSSGLTVCIRQLNGSATPLHHTILGNPVSRRVASAGAAAPGSSRSGTRCAAFRHPGKTRFLLRNRVFLRRPRSRRRDRTRRHWGADVSNTDHFFRSTSAHGELAQSLHLQTGQFAHRWVPRCHSHRRVPHVQAGRAVARIGP